MMSKNNKLYEEGGLATDGVDVDPVSGNDVPPGSNAEDVRDDIPAQLSSGEYVVPADVVKYFGVAHFEKLRAKAKAGLEGMEEDGRMGGEPVDETPQGVSDEDLMKLDGYATGGIVMKDEDVNGIIDRVKAAAMKDPSVSNLLKSKGIYMKDDKTGPSVKGQAGAREYNEGGEVTNPFIGRYDPKNTTSNYNPFAYTPGFSIESGATGVAPGAPVVPDTPTAPVDTAPAPIGCPPGYVLDPATNSCVPDGSLTKTDSRDQNREDKEASERWMSKYDYTDPSVLVEQTLDTIYKGEVEEEENLLTKIAGAANTYLDKGLLGKVFKTQRHAEVMANVAILDAQGYKTEADKLRVAAGDYAKAEGVKTDGFYSKDSIKTLTDMVLGKQSNNLSKYVAPKTSRREDSFSNSTLKSSGKRYQDAGLERARGIVSKRSNGMTGDPDIYSGDGVRGDRPTSWDGGQVVANQANPNRPSNSSSYGQQGAGDGVREDRSVEDRLERAAEQYGGLATGGRATGGLVDKKTKLKKKKTGKGLASRNK